MNPLKSYYVVMFLLFFSCSISAQPATSHTISVRILPLNQFHIEENDDIEQNASYEYSSNSYDLLWKTGRADKMITVQIDSCEMDNEIWIDINGDKLKVHENDAHILNNLQSRQGKSKFSYSQPNIESDSATVIFTMINY